MLCFSSVAVAVGVLAAGQLHAQSLDLKPGCWEVRTEIATTLNHSPQDEKALEAAAQKLPTLDEVMRNTLARMTPEQRAHVDVAQLREEIKGSLEGSRTVLEQELAAAKKPVQLRSASNFVRCSANLLSDLRIAAGDVQRTDALHFTATHRQTASSGSQTVTTLAKWISDATPHMPYSPAPTDLKGHRARGPHDVMWLDQYRVVAVIDGEKLTALEAFLVLNLPPRHYLAADVYKSGWRGVLQHNYMYWAIAYEFDPKMNPPPRDNALQGLFGSFNVGADNGASVDTRVGNYHYVGVDRDEWDREQRLWGVYLSRATTESEKQKLARQAWAKYKVDIVDPDFFAGRPQG